MKTEELDISRIKAILHEKLKQLEGEGVLTFHEKKRDENAETFKKIWQTKIANSSYGELSEENDLDPLIRIIDARAKGVRGDRDCPVGFTYIYQPTWYRIFNDLHKEKALLKAVEAVFSASTDNEAIAALNQLRKSNENKRNGLTGKSANAINALLSVREPRKWLSMVSLDHRFLIMRKFGFGSPDHLMELSYGDQIVQSNKEIIEGYRTKLDLDIHVRFMSLLLYQKDIRPLWRETEQSDVNDDQDSAPHEETSPEMDTTVDEQAFSLEKHLEDFLIANWEKTELGRRYDLIEEDGDMVSKQYKTGIGYIDILAQDKKSGGYVVIELKKGRPSDDVIGQVLRYMGWVQKNLKTGKSVKGMIIALQDDERLKYALQPLDGKIAFYRYKINFDLVESKD